MADFDGPAYSPFQWHDGSSGNTPLNTLDLMAAENSMVAGFQAGDAAVVAWVEANFTAGGGGSGATPGPPVNLSLPVLS